MAEEKKENIPVSTNKEAAKKEAIESSPMCRARV